MLEKMTDEMEKDTMDYIQRIDAMGGMVKAIELGFPQKEIADSAYWYQKALEKKEKIIVGVNAFQSEHAPIPLLEIDSRVAELQLERLKNVRRRRNSAAVKSQLKNLKKAARDEENLMPFLVNCVKSYATLGEIMESLVDVYGRYQEPINY